MRHPIHPMLVHFPVATLFLATLGDIASLFMDEQVSRVAGVLLVIGTITTLLAMVAGLMELGKIDQQSPAMKVANQHMMLMMASWSFLCSQSVSETGWNPFGSAGHGCRCHVCCRVDRSLYRGWLGGKLVYEYGVGTRSSQP